MRDKYSGEVAKTFHQYGFYKKFTDAGWANKERGLMQKQEDPGLADGIFVAIGGKAAFIECKTGDTRFAFDEWKPRQREFHLACYLSGIPYYLFLVMGKDIRDKDYPRCAYLFDPKWLLDMERVAAGKKSVSYATAYTYLWPFKLNWLGAGQWEVPEHHEFWRVLK